MPAHDRVSNRELAELREAPIPGDWAERAACRGMGTEEFFPTRGEMNKYGARRLAKLYDTCPVLAYCRTYSLRYPLKGWWGGMSEDVRRDLRRAKREAS